MGSKLCCDAKQIQNQLSSTKQPQEIIKQFMMKNPLISQVCPTPGQTFGTIIKEFKQYTNGIYIGRIINKKRNGLGIMLFKGPQDYEGGMCYEGEWVDDQFKGRGKFVFSNGDFYDGEWLNCLPEGLGEYFNRETKWKYIGTWEKGLQNGRGKETFADGSVYQGGFLDGQRHGKGKFKNHDGRYYEGSFQKGEVHGSALVVDFDYLYQGQWKNGEKDGAGRSQWYGEDKNLQSTYLGIYKKGVKQGYGQYRDKFGNAFKGNWQKGAMTDTGVIVNRKSNIENGIR